MDSPSLRRETRYGMPAADQILYNRNYITGYSFYFRQPKWTLEIVDAVSEEENTEEVERLDNFRPDYRIPQTFRADLADFRGSGFDRGHLVASANQRGIEIQNSETFLLSNMCPQVPGLNRSVWRKLECAVRSLNQKEEVLETYCITGPVFDFDKPVKVIGTDDANQVSIPVPHGFFKSILTEDVRGNLEMWSFVIPNEELDVDDLRTFQVTVTKIEQWTGIILWDQLVGSKIFEEKTTVRKMWDTD
ncbi:MAG: DNA/RNA non-specific endonuclease [Bacteroidota bacterium]